MEIIESGRRPAPRSTIEFRVLDDLSSVVVSQGSGEAHALTPVATAIFERCDGATTIAQMTGDIVEIFDCTPELAEIDVRAFLDELSARGLIEW